MELTPREKDKLLLFTAALVAETSREETGSRKRTPYSSVLIG